MDQPARNQTKGISTSEMNKIRQKRKILSLLYTLGSSTAPDLSKTLKISLPTCIVLLNDLIAANYIRITGIGESSGGRKPNLYGLADNEFYVMVCDFARFHASMAIMDCHNQFVTPITRIDTHIDDPLMIDKLLAHSQQLISQHNIPEGKVYGLGVDMPGLISSKAGINYTIKDKKRQMVGKDLKQRFNKMIYIDNDARMHAHGEFHFGEAKGFQDAVFIHWSWGLGLGIYIGGKLYSGKSGFAGEFSHIPIVENGELCICGKRGCLETIASSNTIIKLVKQGFANNEISSLINEFRDNPDKVTPEDVINSARQGDEFCISILNEVGKAMGKGLSYLIQLLNPDAIVLSGPLAAARQFVLFPIQQSLNRLCLEKVSGNTEIIISDLGDQSALLGISEMVYQNVFSEIKIP